jgi:acetyl esterase/lipase
MRRRNVLALVLGLAALAAAPARAQSTPPNTYTVTVVPNILYNPGIDHPELGDLYLPNNVPDPSPLPVVVVIHGGDWSNKSPERTKNYKNIVQMANALASSGIPAFAINYTLYDPKNAPQVGVWPQNLQDCKTAVQFLRVNAATYNLDPNRIGVAGTSSGAHLAALVATTDADHGGYEPVAPYPGVSSQVQAAFLMYGAMTDISAHNKPPHWLGPGATVQTELAATPITYVRAGLPPILLSHGTADTTVPIQQAFDYQSALVNATDPTPPDIAEWANGGQSVTYPSLPGLIQMDGLTHGFPIADTGKKDGFIYDLQPNLAAFFQITLPPPAQGGDGGGAGGGT